MSGLSLGIRVSNLKSVALTVLELFAFNSHYKLVRLTGPLRTHRNTDRNTHSERTHYLRHSLSLWCSLGGEIIIIKQYIQCKSFARCHKAHFAAVVCGGCIGTGCGRCRHGGCSCSSSLLSLLLSSSGFKNVVWRSRTVLSRVVISRVFTPSPPKKDTKEFLFG